MAKAFTAVRLETKIGNFKGGRPFNLFLRLDFQEVRKLIRAEDLVFN